MKFIFLAFATLLLMLVTAGNAKASSSSIINDLRCRDCPFPMKIGENRWLMPDSEVIVQIYEQRQLDGSFQMSVSLLDSLTNEVFAAGTAKRAANQRSVNITLIDMQGARIEGTIRWVNFTKSIIQAKFACSSGTCMIDQR